MNNIYKSIEVETEVMGASPAKLVQLLFDKFIEQVRIAKHFIERNEIARKGQSISKAIDIVNYLRLTLNADDPNSKKLAEQLDIVYSYVNKQLLKANLKNDTRYLDDAKSKIERIKNAWDQICGEN